MHDAGVGTPSMGPGSGDACRTCGTRLTERWAPGRTALVRFCGNASCVLYGVPNLRQSRHAVTMNDRGEVLDVR